MLNPYYAQFFVGLPAFPSLLQSWRYRNRENIDQSGIETPLNAPFTGTLRSLDPASDLTSGEVSGRISIQPDAEGPEGRTVHGDFSGTITLANGKSQDEKLTLGGVPRLGKPVTSIPSAASSWT